MRTVLGVGFAGVEGFLSQRRTNSRRRSRGSRKSQFVKLDMSLVRGVDKSSIKQKLVRSMTELCKDMGIAVVAEGIESVEERDAIVGIGCDFLQGYYLGMPGPAFPALRH